MAEATVLAFPGVAPVPADYVADIPEMRAAFIMACHANGILHGEAMFNRGLARIREDASRLAVAAVHAVLTLCDAAEHEGTVLEERRVRAAILKALNDGPDDVLVTGQVDQSLL